MEYPTQYYKDQDEAFHILYVEAVHNIFLDDKRQDRYIELQNIRPSYTQIDEFKQILQKMKHPK